MTIRLKIPISLNTTLYSVLREPGFGNKFENVNQISKTEKRNYRDLQPDLKTKIVLDRVFDLKKGVML